MCAPENPNCNCDHHRCSDPRTCKRLDALGKGHGPSQAERVAELRRASAARAWAWAQERERQSRQDLIRYGVDW